MALHRMVRGWRRPPQARLCRASSPKGTPTFSVIAARCQLPRGGSFWHGGKVSGSSAMLAGVPAPPGGAVAQRLRGFKSAEPKKTVKRSSRRTGVNLQFFPVQPSSLGLKGASSPFFVAPARRNRWHFSGSLLVSKENIHRQAETFHQQRRPQDARAVHAGD